MDMDWNTITKEELTELVKENTNRMISEMYGVTVNQVSYKRKKFGITNYWLAFQSALENGLQQDKSGFAPSHNWLFNKNNIDFLAKADTQYAFRSGPIEDMHIKLTDEDMKILNKYMVDRMAGLLQKAFDGEWEKIADVFLFYAKLSDGWDNAIPDTREFDIKY